MYLMFSMMFFIMSISSLILWNLLINNNSLVLDFCLHNIMESELVISFLMDWVSLMFFSIVSLISSMVFLYSKFYMNLSSKDTHKEKRFLMILMMFVMSMFFLIFSFSWITVMLGWDGLGVTSFLLVIYYNDYMTLDSGIITFLTNRMGDCLFIISFMFMYISGSFSIDYGTLYFCSIYGTVIFLGCMTKSAQIPFSSWLPAAMAAPTPVSSLVHSSTLVTAGIYLIIRFNYLFIWEINTSFYCLCLLTMILAGMVACYEKDLKKVVAMSTLSQLGFMTFCVMTGYWQMGLFHLCFHAFFKSCLFLCTGNLMSFFMGIQDSRNFGNLNMSYIAKTFFYFSCLSLMGFPFFLGFYSKDFIVSLMMYESFSMSSIFYILFCCVSVSYSLRLMKIPFFHQMSSSTIQNFLENKNFFLPVSVIFIMSVFMGDYFVFYCLPINCFFLTDYFLGLMIITSGVYLEKLLSKTYNISYMVSMMFFLKPIFNLSNKTNNNKYWLLSTMMEDLNTVKMLNKMNMMISLLLMKINLINTLTTMTMILLLYYI